MLKGTADFIKCQFLDFNPVGIAHCHLTDAYPKEFSRGCPACVDLPTVEALLDQGSKDNRERYRDEIRQALTMGCATLVLGAGISMPMGMPNWLGLISQMAGYAQQYADYTNTELKDNVDIRRLSTLLEQELIAGNLILFNGVNVLESGQYIEQTIRRASGSKPVQGMLKEILCTIIGQSLTLAQWTKEKWKKDHPSLEDPRAYPLLAAEHNSLCATAYLLNAKHGFRRAMTYNFDTLVQEYLIDLFQVSPERIFTHPGKWSDYYFSRNISDPIDIFHVHGCLPRKTPSRKLSCAFPAESDQVILTESNYYNTEQSEAYNWQNSIQSYYLNRDSCIFVGFSADDYNFRRILRQMETEKHPRHYLILTIDNIARETWFAVCHRHLFNSTSPEQIRQEVLRLLKIQLDMKAEYWGRYNFYPIWVTVDDIPKFLLSLI